MIYTKSLYAFPMQSTWTCAYSMRNGTIVWHMDQLPTESTEPIDTLISLPAGATVKKAWIALEMTLPETGIALLQCNGIDISQDGTVPLEGITADTTMVSAVFAFRAHGMIRQTTAEQTDTLTVTSAVINVEYRAEGELETEDRATGVGSSIKLPRLLKLSFVNGVPVFAEKARLEPSRLKLDLKLHPLSTAEMDLPEGAETVNAKDFIELYSPYGSAGIFRVTEVSTKYGTRSGQSVYMEHALGTLADSLAIGTQAMTAPVAQVISTLLQSQETKLWVLGSCAVDPTYELVYEYTYNNLLQALMELTDMLPEVYYWYLDTSTRPFRMHLKKAEDSDACECRLSRNLTMAELSLDTSGLCTRVYPFGAGEGTDRMTLTNLIGTQYMDSDKIGIWGTVSRTFTAETIYDAPTLKAVAERYLDRHDHPTVSVTLDAVNLYAATGETFDRFWLGRICRLALPDYNTTIQERVVQTSWGDVFGAPESVAVTLANRTRTASDEIAELLRDATNSKLLGGSVETIEENSRAGSITPGSPFVQTFHISGYGNVLNVKIAYTCMTSEGKSVDCKVEVDGNKVDTTGNETRVIDITRYLKTDENGVPVVGEHRVRLEPNTLVTTQSVVDNTITIKQIEKR